MATSNSLENSFDLPLSGQTTDPSGSTTLPHQKIAWAGQTGYPGAKYCCVCSYSTRLKETTECCQPDCPNQACGDCHNDGPFSCTRAGELRQARGIQHPVTYAPDLPDPSSQTPDSQAPLPNPTPSPDQSHPLREEDIAVREELLSSPPVALVDIILRQRGQIHSYKNLVEAYRRESERFLYHRSNLVEIISTLDTLALVAQQDSLPTPTTQATSALPSKIDSDWQEVCSTHPRWQAWWESGKPQGLRKVTRDDDSARPASPPLSRVPPSPATTRSRPTSPTRPHPRHHQAPDTRSPPAHSTHPHHHHQVTSTPRAPQSQREATRKGGNPPRFNKSGKKSRGPLICGRCRQRGHATRQCEAIWCDFCGHKGHLEAECRKRQAQEKRNLHCDYCLRPGHTAASCYTRAAEARQERLFRAILTERQQHPGSAITTPPRQAPSHYPGHPSLQYGTRGVATSPLYSL